MFPRGITRPALLALAAVLAAVWPASASAGLVTGASELLVSAETRLSTGLDAWPDGPIGVQTANEGYVFYAANHGDVQRTKGTLGDPVGDLSAASSIRVEGARALRDVGYAAGGPVYRDPTSGTRLMFIHLERYPTGRADDGWYGSIGLARSTDEGRTWKFLGEIFTHDFTYSQYRQSPGRCTSDGGRSRYGVVNTGYGQYVQRTVNGVPYIYIYAPDTQAPAAGTTTACRVSFAAARAPLGEVMSAASAGRVSTWRKYRSGSWGEPGLGGRSTDLRPRQLKLSFDVSYNAYSGKYLLAATTPRGGGEFALEISESTDGISWSLPQTAFTTVGEIYSPTIIGTGSDPRTSGSSFYVYYGHSESAWAGVSRRLDGTLQRRLITLG